MSSNWVSFRTQENGALCCLGSVTLLSACPPATAFTAVTEAGVTLTSVVLNCLLTVVLVTAVEKNSK